MVTPTADLSTADCVAAIEHHSAGFVAAARGNLEARVEHCPEWNVADLVWHLTNVHWFWATIAEQRPESPPQEGRPVRPADAELLTTFEQGAARLVSVLRTADQQATCWTWAPGQQNVAFITRHQVQEAAVHHWDAVHATGDRLALEPLLAADAISEYLTVSVSSVADPAEPAKPPLDGVIALHATDLSQRWVITDDSIGGTLTFEVAPFEVSEADAPAGPSTVLLEGTASDLLLWLYGRVELAPRAAGAGRATASAVLARFRELTFND